MRSWVFTCFLNTIKSKPFLFAAALLDTYASETPSRLYSLAFYFLMSKGVFFAYTPPISF